MEITRITSKEYYDCLYVIIIYPTTKDYSFHFFIHSFVHSIAEVLFVLTRERFPDPKLIDSVLQKIRKAGLDPSRLRKTNQKSCPYGH